MSAEQLKATVHQLIESLNKGSLDALEECCAVDVIRHSPPYPDVEGLEGYKRAVADWRTAFPDSKFTIKEAIAEGSTVALRLTYEGTHTGPLGSDIPPTGRQVAGLGGAVYHFVNGEIVEMWEYWDELGFWRQLGYSLVPPEKVREE